MGNEVDVLNLFEGFVDSIDFSSLPTWQRKLKVWDHQRLLKERFCTGKISKSVFLERVNPWAVESLENTFFVSGPFDLARCLYWFTGKAEYAFAQAQERRKRAEVLQGFGHGLKVAFGVTLFLNEDKEKSILPLVVHYGGEGAEDMSLEAFFCRSPMALFESWEEETLRLFYAFLDRAMSGVEKTEAEKTLFPSDSSD